MFKWTSILSVCFSIIMLSYLNPQMCLHLVTHFEAGEVKTAAVQLCYHVDVAERHKQTNTQWRWSCFDHCDIWKPSIGCHLLFYHIFNKTTCVLSGWHLVLRTTRITIEVKLCAIPKMSVWQPSIDVPFQGPAITSTIWTLMLQGSSVI